MPMPPSKRFETIGGWVGMGVGMADLKKMAKVVKNTKTKIGSGPYLGVHVC